MRVRFRPGKCLALPFKEPIDHESVSFGDRSARYACCFSANDRGAAVDGSTSDIVKRDFAAVWNFTWINCAIARAQACAIPTGPLLTFAVPIDSDSSEHQLLMCVSRARE